MTKKYWQYSSQLLVVILLVVVLGIGCQQVEESETSAGEVARIPVAVTQVVPADLEKTIPLGGLLKAREEVYVAAKNPVFKITDVLVRVGDHVAVGTPLVTFDSRELDLQLEQALLAKQRNQELYALGAIPKLQLEQTELALENLQIQKESCTLLSPLAGVVATVSALKEQMAGAAPLISIVDLASLELEIQVGEAYINKLKAGTTLAVQIPAIEEDLHFTGVIKTIPPQIDPRTKAYPVILSVPNARGILKDGMYAEVRLVTERQENVLVIPQYAVVELAQKQVVFIVENEQVQMKEVQLGLTLGEQAEVVAGLNEGDALIVEGQYGVRDGSLVTAVVRGEGQ